MYSTLVSEKIIGSAPGLYLYTKCSFLSKFCKANTHSQLLYDVIID